MPIKFLILGGVGVILVLFGGGGGSAIFFLTGAGILGEFVRNLVECTQFCLRSL